MTTTSSLTVVPTFPPLEAARSTVTEPAFMLLTISEVMIKGACSKHSQVRHQHGVRLIVLIPYKTQ